MPGQIQERHRESEEDRQERKRWRRKNKISERRDGEKEGRTVRE